MHDGIYSECRKSGEKGEAPSCDLDLMECPLAVCSSSRAGKTERLGFSSL